MADIKLGIIGTNFVSDWLCDAVKNTAGITLHALYSRTEEKALLFSGKHDITHTYTDMESFLSSDIDAVYIATPNCLHYIQAMDAIEHGKHVLLEKPATLTAGEFIKLSDAAEEHKVVLLEAMRPAHDPAILKARNSIPSLGVLRRAVLEFCQYSSRYDKYKEGVILNAFNPAMGNAAVMDIGVYALEAAVIMFGKPDSVESESVILPNGMEASGVTKLRYGDFTCEVVYSKVFDSVSPSFITGENGSVIIGKISTGENVSLKLRNTEETKLMSDRPIKPELNMIYEVEDFVKIINGEMDITPFSVWTAETLRIIDEIRKQNSIEFK